MATVWEQALRLTKQGSISDFLNLAVDFEHKETQFQRASQV